MNLWCSLRNAIIGLAIVLFGSATPAQSCMIGDSDVDTDIDLVDISFFQNCFGEQPNTDECASFDFDGDETIDIADWHAISSGITGALSGPPTVVVDPVPSPTTSSFATISGEAFRSCFVQVAGGAATVDSPVVDGRFVLDYEITPNRVNRLFVTALTADSTSGAATPVSVTHDLQPPTLFIDFPPLDAELTTPAIDVAGRVGDLLSGFMGLTVEVNGVPAIVDVGIGTNGTFLSPAVPLVLGENTIIASAVDVVGNEVAVETAVFRVKVPSDAPQMARVSGNNQIAPIHRYLPEPIIVQVVNQADGQPFANKVVTFKVTRSNGLLSESGAPGDPESALLQVRTDNDGMAAAFWRLGTDAGCGNNRITVSSTSIAGSIFYCASATPAPAAQINVGSGNNQRGEVNSRAPEPLVAWVSDACNGVSNVPVTFAVVRGGGQVDGQSSTTINTGTTGHAQVEFVFGLEPGPSVVEVTFLGNAGEPARFVAQGVERQPSAMTTFEGIVQDNAGSPIEGATCSLHLPDHTINTVSALDGTFEMDTLGRSGPGHLRIDGTTAAHVGGSSGYDVVPGSFPALSYDVIVIPETVNSLPAPVLLPALNPNNARSYSTTRDTILTVEEIEGLQMIVKAGSMSINGQPAPDGTVIALNQVHADDVPMPMPDGAAPPFAWTLQPGGANFDPPIEIVYPNMSGLPPGSVAYFLSFNHDTHRFEIVATGTVTPDGSCIVTDPGAGLAVAGWGCNCPPYSVTGECCDCGECAACVDGGCESTCNASTCETCVDGVCNISFDAICEACSEGEVVSLCDPLFCEECENGACVSGVGPCQDCTGGEVVSLCDSDACELCVAGACVPGLGECEKCVDGEAAPCDADSCEVCTNSVCESTCDAECQMCVGGSCESLCDADSCLICLDGSCESTCDDECEACEDGSCQTLCELGQCLECLNGNCVVSCGDCEGCTIFGECEFLCDANSCQECEDGSCVDTCPTSACQTCVLGECVSSCEGCTECIDGTCQDTCPTSACQSCVNGVCDDSCDESSCETCFDGACVDVCAGEPCQECVNGACVDACPANACQECVGGFCEDSCDEDVCESCVNGACQSSCDDNLCETCFGGACVDVCSGEPCEACVDGACVQTCPTNACQSCVNGVCESTCDDEACETCFDGACVDVCAGEPCQACVGGACVDTCPTNACQSCVNGQCESTCNQSVCESCANGECRITCQACEICNGGLCVSICPEGEICIDDNCEIP